MDRKCINDGISFVLLCCFYQPFGLSFWRHPFTAKGPLVCKWCNATFFQIYDDKTNSSMIRGWASFLKIVIFLGELFLAINKTQETMCHTTLLIFSVQIWRRRLDECAWTHQFLCLVSASSLCKTMMTWAFQRTAENLHMPVTLMTHRFQRHSTMPVTTEATLYSTTTQVSLSLSDLPSTAHGNSPKTDDMLHALVKINQTGEQDNGRV